MSKSKLLVFQAMLYITEILIRVYLLRQCEVMISLLL